MRPIQLCVVLFLMFSCSSSHDIDKVITKETIEQDIMTLASDEFQGRKPFTEGERKTLDYLQLRMKEIGLEPAFNGKYLQDVSLAEISSRVNGDIVVKGMGAERKFKPSEHFSLWCPVLQPKVSVQSSDLVFVGFGIDAPELAWNDFEGVDVEGKTIVVLVNDPGFHTGDSTLFKGNSMTYYGRWPYKYEEANRKGALACIIVHEDKAAGYPWSIVDQGEVKSKYYINNGEIRDSKCKVNGWVTRTAAEELFAQCGLNYEEMKRKACVQGFKPVEMKAQVTFEVDNAWNEATSYNVGGVIKGSVRPEESLVYVAHWDHFGIGAVVDGDSIYRGATDNAVAVAWMLSIAKAFKSQGEAPERSILFLSPTVEEAGMLGSQYYVKNPVFDHSKTVACFNNDVVLFLGKFLDVTVTGLGHSELDSLLAIEAAKQGRYICNDPNPENGMFFRSDQMPFLKAGVPALFAKGYSHQAELGRERTLEIVDEYWRSTYHKPSDKYIPSIHKLDGVVDDAKLFFSLGNKLANSTLFPKWSKDSEFYVER